MAEQYLDLGSSVSRRRTRLTADAWEPHQVRIRQLYLEQDKSAEETLRIMESECGFIASVSQFNHQVRSWGIRKNLNEQDLDFIENRKRQRDALGQETWITLCGRPINVDDLPRKRQRKFHSIMEQLQTNDNVCPSTPPGLFVGSPPQTCLQARSPSPFSWLAEYFEEVLDTQSFPFTINPLYLRTPSYSFETILFEARASFLKDLTFVPHRNQDIERRNVFEPASIKDSQVRNLMSPSRAFNSCLSLEDLISFLKIYIIRLGNNVGKVQAQCDILDALLQSDVLTAHMPVLGQLLQADSVMVNNFVIQLFYSAARTGILDTLRLVLRLYDNNNSHSAFWRNNRNVIIATAAQFALERQQGAGYSLLLSTGFDVNASPLSQISNSLFHTAIMAGNIDILQELIRHGGKDTLDEHLGKRLRENDEYFKHLEEMGYIWVKTVQQYKDLTRQMLTQNGLHLAFILRKKDITELLLSLVEEGMRSFTYSEVDTSKLHFFAILIDDNELLRYILKSPDLDTDVEEEIRGLGTGLVAAVTRKREKCVQTLLASGADPEALVRRADLLTYKWKEEEKKFLEKVELGSMISKIDIKMKELKDIRNSKRYWIPDPIEIDGKFPYTGKNKTKVLSYIDAIFRLSGKTGAQLKHSLSVFEHLVRMVSFTQWDDDAIYISMAAILWDPESVSGVKSVATYIGECLGISLNLEFGYMGPHIEIIKEFSFSERWKLLGVKRCSLDRTKRERTILEWQRTCMDVVDPDTGDIHKMALDDYVENEMDPTPEEEDIDTVSYRLNFASATSRLRSLDAKLKLGFLEDLEFILEWALSVSNAGYLRSLVSLCLPYIDSMTLEQRQAILRLAVHRGFQAIIERILSLDNAPRVTDMILREAVWGDDTGVFDRIMDAYDLQEPIPDVIEQMLVVPICSANLHKVARMVESKGFNVNFLFGDTFTFIELAAKLGRADITKVLLEKGASRNIDRAIKAASDSGHFALAEMIRNAPRNRSNTTPSERASEAIAQLPSQLQPNGPFDQTFHNILPSSSDETAGFVNLVDPSEIFGPFVFS